MGTFYGTLDYFGRPMIIINKKNVMHTLATGPVRIYYNYNPITLWRKPIIMFALIFILCLAKIVLSKLKLNLKEKDEIKIKNE